MPSSVSSILDSGFFDHGCDNSGSHQTRSRAGTVASNCSESYVHKYSDSPASQPLSSPSLTSQSASSASSSTSSAPYLSPIPSNYLSTTLPRNYSPFTGLSPEILSGEWSEQDPRIVNPAVSTGPVRTASFPLDPSFTMGKQNTYPWPGVMTSPNHNATNFLGHDLSSMSGAPGSEAEYGGAARSRSRTGSPQGHHVLTPEQRELKRQMDQVRRDNKSASRFRRSNSNTYLPDASSAMNVPIYTSSMAPISLLAEPANSVPTQSYLSPYAQPLAEQDAGSMSNVPMYASSLPQQSMQPAYNMPMGYPTTLQASDSAYGPPRSASYSTGSDPNLMYPMGAGMPGNGVPLSGHESGQVRVVQTRPKPQCWEHGCNGRQFSTFSNLLRHQREKSGQASKATCPNCGAEFTRTTARNGHLLQGKCKKRGASDDAGQPLSRSPSASSLADDVRQLHDPALRD